MPIRNEVTRNVTFCFSFLSLIPPGRAIDIALSSRLPYVFLWHGKEPVLQTQSVAKAKKPLL